MRPGSRAGRSLLPFVRDPRRARANSAPTASTAATRGASRSLVDDDGVRAHRRRLAPRALPRDALVDALRGVLRPRGVRVLAPPRRGAVRFPEEAGLPRGPALIPRHTRRE